MRYIEWAVMFLVAGIGIALANFVGFQVTFMDSVPGILILLAISFVSVVISKLVPFAGDRLLFSYRTSCGKPVMSGT